MAFCTPRYTAGFSPPAALALNGVSRNAVGIVGIGELSVLRVAVG
jgi:hypothetical protein